MIDLNKRNKK